MLLIKNGNIHTMAGEVIEGGSVLMEGGKIKAVGKEVVAPLDAEIIDVEGRMVLPGFIDAHCHVGLFESAIGFEGDDGNEATDPVTPQIRGIDGINPMDETLREAYEGGVTTAATGPGSANVIGGQFALIKTYGNRVDNMVLDDSIAMKIAFGENPKRVYNNLKKSPMTRMATASILRETLFKAKAYVEKQNRAEGDLSKMPDFDMKMEAMARVIRKEIPLKAHAHRADDIFTALRIAKEFDVDITLDHCTEGHLIADELVKDGKPAIIGPTFGDKSKFELKNKSFDTPKVLHEAGVKFAIMTDAPVIPLDKLVLCAAWAANAGLDEEEAFKSITINPAEILGVDNRLGSIENGKDADIVVFNGHPLRDIRAKVNMTIIDGKVVYRES
ncbi:amidohydrolase [Clostridium sp. D2Q-14]|uniref:amidohydrolase n=1 Tax=Anaeromonas gelatinilytica TaxID=2683194 RepID=UPI00193B22A2|nr:amidohydrolase [Anaeromonas gelatinilytica]MBS4534630.1 amidohydrolase [Anaeromonas gelatinilytica]